MKPPVSWFPTLLGWYYPHQLSLKFNVNAPLVQFCVLRYAVRALLAVIIVRMRGCEPHRVTPSCTVTP